MIVMRHGESEFNVVYGRTGTDPGIRDPKLTARGRDQVVVSHWWFIRALTGAALANAAMVRVRLAPAVDVVSHPHP